MNMSKSRDIQAKMPSPKVIYASNESKSVLARNLEECRDNDKNSQSVFLSFKCILARNCEGTEQLRNKINQKVQRKLYGLIRDSFIPAFKILNETLLEKLDEAESDWR